MTLSFAIKAGLILLFVGSILYVHFRGKARLPVLRQFVNHSAFFAPYNALMYLFSGVPSKPYLDRSKFPELDVLKDNWQAIREEAMHLFDEGYIRRRKEQRRRFWLVFQERLEAFLPQVVRQGAAIGRIAVPQDR